MTRYPSLDAVLCSHAAFACFMNARTFEGAILSAINLGGDADTVGACCGALAGAYWGMDAIPQKGGVLIWRVMMNWSGTCGSALADRRMDPSQ